MLCHFHTITTFAKPIASGSLRVEVKNGHSPACLREGVSQENGERSFTGAAFAVAERDVHSLFSAMLPQGARRVRPSCAILIEPVSPALALSPGVRRRGRGGRAPPPGPGGYRQSLCRSGRAGLHASRAGGPFGEYYRGHGERALRRLPRFNPRPPCAGGDKRN